MATHTFRHQPRPYESRRKTDSRGCDHWQIYLPSNRGYAWVELIDLPDDPELRDQILDPDFLPEWKIAYLEALYREFRDRENARKRGDISSSDFEYESEALCPVATGTRPPSPEESLEIRETLAEILLPLTPTQRHYVIVTADGGSDRFMRVAREENPDATPAELRKIANRIRSVVNRALKQISKNYHPRTN